MMRWFDELPFRIGTSSYIIPDDILPNVRWLSEKVKDVELVLFDVDEYCNVPDAELISELNCLAGAYGLTYTVHLPLDLCFNEAKQDVSIEKALKVMRSTEDLMPWAYVCHLTKGEIPDESDAFAALWQAERIRAVKQLLSQFPAGRKLAIENLECYPAEWNLPVIDACGTSMTLDIGHLWLQQRDCAPLLERCLDRISVIHLHGIGTRDHQSLTHQPYSAVKALMKQLLELDYRGVLTLEVFNQDDFESSMDVLAKAFREVR